MKSITEREKIVLSIVIILIFAIGIYIICWDSIDQQWTKLKEEKVNVNTEMQDGKMIQSEYDKLLTEKENITDEIKEATESYKGTNMNKERFLVFFNNITVLNNLRVLSFINQGDSSSDKLEKSNYAIEVKGSLENINNMLQEMSKQGIKFSVGNLSVRADGTYDFLQRNFDNATDFEWYNLKPSDKSDADSIISGDCKMFFTINMLSYMEE